jgi:hypothetical protein
MVVAVLAVLAVAGGLAAGFGAGGGGAPRPSPVRSSPARPAPAAAAAADVSAARACQAFSTYLADASAGTVPQAAGQALVTGAEALLAGAKQDQAAGRPLPKWATLGANLISAADDVVHHDSASLQTDGAAAAQECQTVPAAAARAGGFVRPAG